MGGNGCRRDKVFVEGPWKTIKCEEFYLHAHEDCPTSRGHFQRAATIAAKWRALELQAGWPARVIVEPDLDRPFRRRWCRRKIRRVLARNPEACATFVRASIRAGAERWDEHEDHGAKQWSPGATPHHNPRRPRSF
jgi:hypothetical protein